MLGVSYLREQNHTDALREFLRAADADPERADIQQALAQAYQLKKAYKEAEEHYLKALKLTPGDPQIENNLGALYLDMRRWDDAIRLFRKAADNLLFSSPEVALTGLGFAYFQKSDYPAAAASYQEAILHNPRFFQAHLRLGQALYAMDRTEQAVTELERALQLVPENAEGHYLLGQAYMKLREIKKAETQFREVIRLAPESEFARQAKGVLSLL